MKQPCSTHNRFCSEKKKEKVVRVRLELTTLTLSARLQYLSPKKKLSLWGSNSWSSRYSMTLYHTEAAPYVPQEPKANKILTSHKRTSWEHDYVRLALFVVSLATIWQGYIYQQGLNGNTLIALTKRGRIMIKGTTWHKNWKIINAQSPFSILEIPCVSF